MISKNDKGKNNNITINSNQIETMDINIQGNNNNVIIEEGVFVRSYLNINICGNNCIVHIKKNTTIEGINISMIEEDNYVLIGNDCMFARGINILASDFHSIIDKNTGKRINNQKGVIIENHVWVARNALILKNTTINNNSVVAAGAVVSGTFPSYCVIGGVPGKVIRKNITWDRDALDSKEIAIPESISEAPIEYNIEENLATDHPWLLGWAFLKKVTTKNSQFLFLVIDKKNKKHYYPGYKYNSGDVADYFKNKAYSCTRFKSFIGISINDIAEIRIIIIEKNKGYIKTIYNSKSNVKKNKKDNLTIRKLKDKLMKKV